MNILDKCHGLLLDLFQLLGSSMSHSRSNISLYSLFPSSSLLSFCRSVVLGGAGKNEGISSFCSFLCPSSGEARARWLSLVETRPPPSAQSDDRAASLFLPVCEQTAGNLQPAPPHHLAPSNLDLRFHIASYHSHQRETETDADWEEIPHIHHPTSSSVYKYQTLREKLDQEATTWTTVWFPASGEMSLSCRVK